MNFPTTHFVKQAMKQTGNEPESLKSYQFDELTVQSYFDEQTTRRLYDYVRANGKLGRTRPPRRGFTGMFEKLLWEKKFSYEGISHIVQGGGEQIAIFEAVPVKLQKEAKADYRRCVICEMRHPESDLVESDQGPMCEACYEVWFPACTGCGLRVPLPEGAEPGDDILCEDCLENGA